MYCRYLIISLLTVVVAGCAQAPVYEHDWNEDWSTVQPGLTKSSLLFLMGQPIGFEVVDGKETLMWRPDNFNTCTVTFNKAGTVERKWCTEDAAAKAISRPRQTSCTQRGLAGAVFTDCSSF